MRTTGSGFHDADGASLRVLGPPRHAVEARIGCEASSRRARAGRADRRSRRRGRRRGRRSTWASPALRARESPRSDVRCEQVEASSRRGRRPVARRRSGRRRSRGTAGAIALRSESRSRLSSPVRSAVATTRSNDGSSCGTGRRLRDVRADRTARLRAPCRPRTASRTYVLRSRASFARRVRPRAPRRRRRLDGRHSGDPREHRRRAAAGSPKRRPARPRGVAEPRPRRGSRSVRRSDRRRRRRAFPDGSSGSLATSRFEERGRVRRRRRARPRCRRPAGPRSRPRERIRAASLEGALQLTRSSTPPSSSSATCSSEHGLRYDPTFGESEDYDLWSRVLSVAEGDSVEAPLVLYRRPSRAGVAAGAGSSSGHVAASTSRCARSRRLRRTCPVRARSSLAGRDRGWGSATRCRQGGRCVPRAPASLRGCPDVHEPRPPCRAGSGGARARAPGAPSAGSAGVVVLGHAVRLDATLPAHIAARRARRRSRPGSPIAVPSSCCARLRRRRTHPASAWRPSSRSRRRTARRFSIGSPRSPDIDLTVIYAADTVARRTWRVEPKHRAVFLRGLRFPGAQRVLHHDYPLTPGVVRALTEARPAVVVISGWSTFAAQAAITWCRLKDVPVRPRRREPRRRAAGGLAANGQGHGRPACRAERLGRPRHRNARARLDDRARRCTRARARLRQHDRRRELRRAGRPTCRAAPGAAPGARCRPRRRRRALGRPARAGEGARRRSSRRSRLRPTRASFSSSRETARSAIGSSGSRANSRCAPCSPETSTGSEIVELYVAADVFALLSEREPWAVVVNEAAACGLPLVLSDRVGAAHDLLRDGENGALVPAGDVEAAAAGAARPRRRSRALRQAQGARSRELARDWGYGPSVEGFLAAVREAVEPDSLYLASPAVGEPLSGSLAECPEVGSARASSSSTSTTGRASRRPRTSSPSSARRSRRTTTSRSSRASCTATRDEPRADRAQRRPHHACRLDVLRALGARAGGP